MGEEEGGEVLACEKRVVEVIRESPMVKLLLLALDRNGCKVTPWRHVACETCHVAVDGGYDAAFNQIVICSNRCKSKAKVEQILVHELVHLYDHCCGHLDLKKMEHLACTEVRAANIAHCKFGIFDSDDVGPLGSRQDCVKQRAARSVSVIKAVSKEVALEAVEQVFLKCYKDTEPVGRYTYSRDCEKRALNDYKLFSKYLKVNKDPPKPS